MQIRDERDIYIAFAERLGSNDVILLEKDLPFSKTVIAAAIRTTIEKLTSGEWKPIHPQFNNSREKEIDSLRALIPRLADFQTIDPEDRIIVDQINKIGQKLWSEMLKTAPDRLSQEMREIVRKYVMRGVQETIPSSAISTIVAPSLVAALSPAPPPPVITTPSAIMVSQPGPVTPAPVPEMPGVTMSTGPRANAGGMFPTLGERLSRTAPGMPANPKTPVGKNLAIAIIPITISMVCLLIEFVIIWQIQQLANSDPSFEIKRELGLSGFAPYAPYEKYFHDILMIKIFFGVVAFAFTPRFATSFYAFMLQKSQNSGQKPAVGATVIAALFYVLAAFSVILDWKL